MHALYSDQRQTVHLQKSRSVSRTYFCGLSEKNIKLMYFIQLLLEYFNREIREYRE